MKLILLFSLLFASTSSFAFKNEYATSLTFVASIGQWKNNDQKGYFRFITKTYGSEDVFSVLYVQWLTFHVDGESESKILNEIVIEELKGHRFTTPRCITESDCSNIYIIASESFGHGRTYKFILKFPRIGVYTINKLPYNKSPNRIGADTAPPS